MDKKEIQKKINNLPKPEYLYQRYNGEIRKYEVQDNLLINIKNANDIIDTDRQIILGKTSEDILDLLEVGDIIEHGIITIFKTFFENLEKLDYFVNIYKNEDFDIKSILTHEQFEKNKFKM